MYSLYERYLYLATKLQAKTMVNSNGKQTEKPVAWTKSEARKVLRNLLMNDKDGTVHKMDVNDVYKLSSLFKQYNINKFEGYLSTLKRNMEKRKKQKENTANEKPPDWRTSEARKELRDRLMNDKDGAIHKMDVNDVHKLSPLFKQYNIKKFQQYLETLKKSIGDENWKTSEAKKKLRNLLMNDKDGTIRKMDIEDVQKLSPLFEPYSIKKFQRYLETLMKEMQPKPSPWATSLAKSTLKDWLENDTEGLIASMDAADVRMKSSLFQAYEEKKFKEYFKNLKESIKRERKAVQDDEEFLRHDMGIVEAKKLSSRGYPLWHKHDAKKLLRKDVQSKLHKSTVPSEFQKSRKEYKEFPSEIFRKHIYQEETSQLARSYWLNKKRLSEEAKMKAKQKKEKQYLYYVDDV